MLALAAFIHKPWRQKRKELSMMEGLQTCIQGKGACRAVWLAYLEVRRTAAIVLLWSDMFPERRCSLHSLLRIHLPPGFKLQMFWRRTAAAAATGFGHGFFSKHFGLPVYIDMV